MSETEAPILWAENAGVALGPLRADLAHEYWRWESDPGAVLGYGRQVPESPESRAEGLQHQLRGAPDQARFTVYDVRGTFPNPLVWRACSSTTRCAPQSSSWSSPLNPGVGEWVPTPLG